MGHSDSQTCIIENLEPRLLMSGSVSASLLASARQVDISPTGAITIAGEIFDASQPDVYRFTAQARGRIYIDMAADGSAVDSFLTVLNSRGRRIRRNNNASRHTLDSRTRFSVRAGRTYYVMASGARQSSGAYRLALTSKPRDDFGNSFEFARYKRLSRRGSGRLSGRINYGQDEDVFKIVAARSGRMRISQTATGRRNALQGQVMAYDSDNALMAISEQVNGMATFDVIRGQAYYLKVAGLSGSSGRYRIRILPTISNLLATAQEVNVPSSGGTTINGTLAAVTAADGYKFTARASGVVYIDMKASSGSRIDPLLSVFNSRGRRIRRNNNASRRTLDSRIRLRVKEGRTYYVEADKTNTVGGTYNLTLTSVPRDDMGNTFATARGARLNRYGKGYVRGRINYADDVDLLAVVAARTGTMFIDMTARGSSRGFVGELTAYDADGAPRAGDLDRGGLDAGISFDVVKDNTYYIQVAGYDAGKGRYRLAFGTRETVVPPPPAQTPQAQQAVTANVRSLPGGLQLLVLGTDGADTITLSQSAGSMTLTADSGTYGFDGDFSSVAVYGFGGRDVIRLDDTVTADSLLYAGAGDDTIFESGPGSGSLYGGAGDDLLVSLGGRSDALYGQDGYDSFWLDATDNLSDASAGESIGRTVHRVTEFYQPYTYNRSSSAYVSLEIAGQDLVDPTLTSYASRYASFAAGPLFVDGPQYNDMAQGYVGDCYYLASLSGLAYTDPGIVEQTIAPLGDGTFAVRFFRNNREVFLRIDADLPVNGRGSLVYAGTGGGGDLWVPLMEKAYAYFRYGQNSYASINGGWMGTVFREITNLPTTTLGTGYPSGYIFDYISSSINLGRAVTAGTYSDASGPIVGSHAYVVTSVQATADGGVVTVFNPWGVDGRSWDGNYYDGLLTISIGQFRQYFSAIVVSVA